MNIFHLEASPGWGGQEMRILLEAEGMRMRGHRVFLAVMKGGRLASEAARKGFVVHELNFQRYAWPLCLVQLLFYFVKYRIFLVNTHSSLDAWIGGIAARLSGRKIIRTRHLSTPVKKGLNSRIVYGWLADYVVTTCSSIIPSISLQSKKSAALFRSIPTGVDLEKIQASPVESKAFRESLKVREEDFLIGTACFMRSWKGIEDLLQAAHRLRHLKHVKWVVIGGGHAEKYVQRAHVLQLEEIVFFTGHLDRPFAAIGALDAFALLSTANEGVSQAILQAACLSKPLIATNTGGLGEVCIDGITGLQVPVFSPDSVAEKVLVLEKDRALCEKFGKAAHELAMRKFTLRQMLNETEEIYATI